MSERDDASPPISLDDLERRATIDATKLDGLHGDPSKRGGWIGHRDYARALVLLIPRLRRAEADATAAQDVVRSAVRTIAMSVEGMASVDDLRRAITRHDTTVGPLPDADAKCPRCWFTPCRRMFQCAPAASGEVVVQLIHRPLDLQNVGLRLVVDGEVVDTGSFGGEPEDAIECRDYKWVKAMLVGLASRLGAAARIETVECDDSDQAYYAAMAAPYVAKEQP